MKASLLKKIVQGFINKKVSQRSKYHVRQEMDIQIETLIEVISPSIR